MSGLTDFRKSEGERPRPHLTSLFTKFVSAFPAKKHRTDIRDETRAIGSTPSVSIRVHPWLTPREAVWKRRTAPIKNMRNNLSLTTDRARLPAGTTHGLPNPASAVILSS